MLVVTRTVHLQVAYTRPYDNVFVMLITSFFAFQFASASNYVYIICFRHLVKS